jgi:hypothetical protein
MQTDEMAVGLAPVLACILGKLVEKNDMLVPHPTLSKFHSVRAPAISIKDYLLRIAKYAACSGECFVLALVYIDRIIQNNPTFIVNSLNIHRLLITGVMLAAKFYDDQYYNNAYFGKVGGVPCGEMNSLEVEFLFMCNFSFAVPPQQYEQYYTELYNHARQVSAGCSCYQQRLKVPELVFPLADAGSKASDRPPFVEAEEKNDNSETVARSPRSSPNPGTQQCALDAPNFGAVFADSLPTCS